MLIADASPPLSLPPRMRHPPPPPRWRASHASLFACPTRVWRADLEPFSTAYDVPAGHRLALVVDTVDPLHIEHNPSGAQLTFSSPPRDPSYVSVPLREQ